MLAAYNNLLATKVLSSNPAQAALALKLDALSKNLSYRFNRQNVKGLYIQGNVGCGKTRVSILN
jgi:predicted ATPase